MHQKLDEIERRYEELQRKMGDPEIVTDVAAYRDTMKATAEIQEVVAKYRQLKEVEKRRAETREMLQTLKSDDELRELAELELAELEQQAPAAGGGDPGAPASRRIRTTRRTSSSRSAPARAATRPRSSPPRSSACTSRYAETQRWKVEVTVASESAVGGIKEVIAMIERRQGLQPAQVRERRAPRAARAGDRDAGAHPHLDRHRGGAAGGRGSRRPDRRRRTCGSIASAPRGRAGRA